MSVETFYYNFKNKKGLIELLLSLDVSKLWRIRIDVFDEKTRLQEERYHAMLGDVARQSKHLNQVFELDDWKRLCVKAFADDCVQNNLPRLAEYWLRNKVRIVPSLDGSSLVALGAQTRDFPKYVAAGFIEWLMAYGATSTPPISWSVKEPEYDQRYAA